MQQLNALSISKTTFVYSSVDSDILNVKGVRLDQKIITGDPISTSYGAYGVTFIDSNTAYPSGPTIPLMTFSSTATVYVTLTYYWPSSLTGNFQITGNWKIWTTLAGAQFNYSRPSNGIVSLTLSFNPVTADLGVAGSISLGLSMLGIAGQITVVQNGATLYTSAVSDIGMVKMPFVRVYIADSTPKVITLQYDAKSGLRFDTSIPIYLTIDGVTIKTLYVQKRSYAIETITVQTTWTPTTQYVGKYLTFSFAQNRNYIIGTNITMEVA
jgi:hypothetical protein